MKKQLLCLVAVFLVTVLSACNEKEKITDENLSVYVQGITDIYVIRDSENIDWMKNVTYDGEIVKSITCTSNDVDLSRVNDYEIIYTIILDPEKAYYDSGNNDEIRKTVTVKVVTESVAGKIAEESVKKVVIWGDNSVEVTAEAGD